MSIRTVVSWTVIVVAMIGSCVGYAKELTPTEQKLSTALEYYYNQQYDKAFPAFKEIAKTMNTADVRFWMGSSAARSGNCDEGIGILESLLTENPDQSRIRMELGEAYLLCGKKEKAKSEFDTVLATNPPMVVKNKIKRLTSEKPGHEKSKWFARLASGLQYDSNVNSGPDNDLLLDPNSQKQSSINLLFDGKGVYFYDIGKPNGYTMTSTASLFYSHSFKDAEYNFMSLDLGTGINWEKGVTLVRMPIGLTYNRYGGDSLSWQIHIDPSVDYFIAKDISLKGMYSLSKENYMDNEYQDAGFDNVSHAITIGPSFYFKEKHHVLTGLLSYTLHNADWDIQSYDGIGLTLSYLARLTDDKSVYLQYEYLSRKYDGTIQGPNESRDDSRHGLLTQYLQKLTPKWFYTAELSYYKNNSNIDFFEFNKITGTITVGYMME